MNSKFLFDQNGVQAATFDMVILADLNQHWIPGMELDPGGTQKHMVRDTSDTVNFGKFEVLPCGSRGEGGFQDTGLHRALQLHALEGLHQLPVSGKAGLDPKVSNTQGCTAHSRCMHWRGCTSSLC